MLEIKQQLIPIGHPNRAGTKTIPIACVVHYTANDMPSATDTANANYFSRKYISKNGVIYEANGKDKFRYGSTQWIIDQDSATLVIPQNEVVWGCGDRQLPYENGYKGQTKIAKEVFNHKQNYLTINYEICNNDTIKNSDKDWQMSCENAIKIIAQDMIKFNIPITMVYKHQELSGKICPKPFIDNPKSWVDFKNKLQQEIINQTIKEVVSIFKDEAKISIWAKDSVKRVSDLGLIKGNEKNEFLPKNPITREEVAIIIDRLLKLLGK